MNLTSGKFTAPRDGIYFFSFIGSVGFSSLSKAADLTVTMYLNGKLIGSGETVEVPTGAQYESLSVQSTLNLQAGDQIWLQISTATPETFLDENPDHYNHFSGWLLDENISQSLNTWLA